MCIVHYLHYYVERFYREDQKFEKGLQGAGGKQNTITWFRSNRPAVLEGELGI
jgi:hypothetical protein